MFKAFYRIKLKVPIQVKCKLGLKFASNYQGEQWIVN